MSIKEIIKKCIPDKLYLKLMYYRIMDEKLDFNNPKTFNEKLQWLKLYDRNPLYTQLVDKYEIRKYISEQIGEEYLIPLIGVWDKFDDIDFSKLPNEFVLKCTHDSGGIVICKDKKNFNINQAKKKIEKSLRNNYYYAWREWPYKNVQPKIIAEKYMEDSIKKELRDYKFFCFNGEVKCFKVDFDRYKNHQANYYDKENNLLPFGEVVCPPDYTKKIELPKSIKQMIEFAERLSVGIPFLRVDFYDVDGNIYFGELTFYPAGGFGEFSPSEWDTVLGEWIELPI